MNILKGKIEFLVIPIDNSMREFKISSTNYLCYRDSDQEWQAIPPRLDGEYVIYTDLKYIDEIEASELVHYENGEYVYRNYDANSLDDAWNCITAIESLKSLFKLNNLNIKIWVGEPEPNGDVDSVFNSNWYEELPDNYLILIKKTL